ncbi:MAG: metallophosphoesterase [Cytophagales bacterium]|nr:metallophosphoesterase [Cytophagales bacterium]
MNRFNLTSILLILFLVLSEHAASAQIDPPDNIQRPANYAPIKQHRFTGDWYMVVGSDPQFPFPPKNLKNATDDRKRLHSVASMKASIGTINWLQRATRGRVKGLILNGDLTNSGSEEQMKVYETLYKDLKVPLYPGLGNHDFNKNDKNAIRSIQYLSKKVIKHRIPPYSPDYHNLIKKVVTGKANTIEFNNPAYSFDALIKDNNPPGDKENPYPAIKRLDGSLAYSWEVGDIHFVQLNNHPLYIHKARNSYDWDANILPSLVWLYGDLQQARNRGKQIIVNFHQMGDDKCHFPLPLTGELQNGAKLSRDQRELMNKVFADIMNRFKVLAIFVGHQHESFGITGQNIQYKGENILDVPVFKCGAVFYHNLMTIEVFERERKIIIHPLRSRLKVSPTNITQPKLISEIDLNNPYQINYR